MLRRFGMTFQFGALFDSLPIWQNITFRLRQNKHLSKKKPVKPQLKLLFSLASKHVLLTNIQLSVGGMQKRVALARAIADKPKSYYLMSQLPVLIPLRAV